MKLVRNQSGLLTAIATALVIGGASGAHAQGYTPIYSQDFGNPVVSTGDNTTGTVRGRPVHAAVGYLPLVNFYQSGTLPNLGTSGTNSIHGGLIAADLTIAPNPKGGAVDVGAWYFQEGNGIRFHDTSKSNLYEFHGRLYFSTRRDIGFQGGVLGTDRAGFRSQKQYPLFIVTEYSSQRLRRRTRFPWGIQAGAGTFIDPNFDANAGEKRTTYGPTFFISGAVDVGNRFNFLLSEWYIRNRDQDVNRVAFGIGYTL